MNRPAMKNRGGAGVMRRGQQGVSFNAMWNGSKTFADVRGGGSEMCTASGYCDRSLAGDTEKSLVPTQPTSWAYVSGSSGPQYGYIIEFLGTGKGESKDVQQVCNSTAAPAYLCRRPMFRVTSYGRGRGMGRVVLQANIISQPQ